ncbi:MAG: flagellar biosynthesis anti-sigma factor FlgM [Chloroflexi bacterium HGW-Chloroflexi-10]|nr:MAG: flagellar biosynthesis anti-sigma factor FlgM [Chloroflexi bacterium HGW-Chloroflexi-10]
MKIENNSINPLSSKKTEETRSVEQTHSRPDAKRVDRSRDKMEISESARLLAKARVALSEMSETETAKLDELQRSIKSGNYSVPVEELAQKMMRFFKP